MPFSLPVSYGYLVDIFEEPTDDVPFQPFRLDPERLTGRKEVQS